MPDPISGIMAAASIGSSIIGGISSDNAADAQVEAANLGVAEQRAAREELRRLLQPYVNAGTPALRAQMDLLGLGTERSQQQAIAAQENSPLFQALARQGEDAILQSASATGGLRGGNVQGALAQFRPALLNDFIERQYSKLGGLTQLGQNSAAGVGAAGMQGATSIADLLGQAGAARAGGALGVGNAIGSGLGNLSFLAGMRGFGGGGGGSSLVDAVNANIAANPSIF